MANKFLVSVSASQVSAARWTGGRFRECEVFPNTEEGLAAFRAVVADAKQMPVHMMVDAVEEDYRFESLPHSFGSDRGEMVGRKLKQHYRNTPYCSARLQGRDAGKRRDDRYLFCALTNPELITPWVEALREHELPMAGIYLLPTVSQALVEKLQLKQTNLLVVSIHSSGLRLTFFRDQKLRTSRLARIDSSGQQALKGYAEEISNTRLYLHALRIMTLDEQLSVLVLDRNDTMTELATLIARDNPNVECRHLGRAEIISKLAIAASALDSSSDALYLHLLGLSAPESNLAPAAITQTYRQHQARRGVYALAAVSVVAISGWCAVNAYQIYDTRNDIEVTKRQTAELQARYQEATRQFPAAPTTAENLKRAVDISQKIGATTRSPDFMMSLVSRSLERHPEVVMKTFGWKYGRTDIDPDASARTAKQTQDATPQQTGAAVARRQSGLVEGEIRPFRGDYRTAIEAINRFAATLAEQPEVAEVRVLKLPLNINPTLTLSGNTTDSREQAGKAEFRLLLLLKQS